MRTTISIVTFVAFAWANAAFADGVPAPPPDPDVGFLQRHGVGPDTASIVAYLKGKSASDADLADVAGVVKRLGAPTQAERVRAARGLEQLDACALPALRVGCDDADAQIARSARELLSKIEKANRVSVPLVACRVLARRGVAEAVEALLRYLPFVADPDTEEEVWYSLEAVALAEGKVHPAVVAALTDKMAARRAFAGCLAGRAGTVEQRAKVRELLKDADAVVRLRSAQGLLAGPGKDAETVPALMGVLVDGDIDTAWQAEELLHFVAGDASPSEVIGAGTAEERKRCRAAWEAWWREKGVKQDLKALEKEARRPGLVFLAEENAKGDGEWGSLVWLCGYDGKPRWQAKMKERLANARLLPGGRLAGWVSTKEEQSRYVEMDIRGKITREIRRDIPTPTDYRVLSGGRVLAACSGALISFDESGEDRAVLRDRSRDAYKRFAPEGRPYFRGLTGQRWTDVVELSPNKEEEVRLFRAKGSTAGFNVWVQPIHDGQFLLKANLPSGSLGVVGKPWYWEWRTLRVDRYGAILTEVPMLWQSQLPPKVSCLRSGNLLVTESRYTLELNAQGKSVWGVYLQGDNSNHTVPFSLVRFGLARPGTATKDPKGLEPLLKAVEQSDDSTLRYSLLALHALGYVDRTAAKSVLRHLNHPDRLTREEAFSALAAAGDQGRDAIPDLLRMLRHEDERRRKTAASILGRMGEPAFPELMKAFEAPAPEQPADYRAAIAMGLTLQLLPSPRPEAIVAVRKAFGDADPQVRRMAADALCWPRLTHQIRLFVPELTAALRDKDEAVAKVAFEALETQGKEAKAAIPELLKLEKQASTRYQAQCCLCYLAADCPDELLPKVLEWAKQNEDVTTRALAVRGLGRCANSSEDALVVLIDLLEDGRSVATQRAIHSTTIQECVRGEFLRLSSPTQNRAMPHLIRLEKQTRSEATKSLATRLIGLVEALQTQTEDEWW